MYSKWNSETHYPPAASHLPPGQSPQQMTERLKSLEDQMALLIKLMESNNQLLRSIEEQQNRVCTSGGGGSVIVRM
ncbi:hypothetical protein ACH95_18410 [Bacillus glycinifermentans]|uniref:YkzH n=1 Tax=Bacillus glycinifermentans TaxID=1664069 RepID=A0A0J6E3V6_9BACI|nr:hypothetical protein [Bacillus glycinifermentans]ATH91916.1 hypothetical protein COP00_04195 [Bacillus glycinifermentans]KMM55898.1 hypothetical protein ACH95_18410 [Bacillus glycinifermentans]KRT92856.1 hypothetical protein AB447_221465 [Bacillus glycinifermentans]MEC0486225.1 hypothetical protein [Bacillus glycinifermentans]MEC0494939.1 hypothetical protein [Bacillus glycinifermentans]